MNTLTQEQLLAEPAVLLQQVKTGHVVVIGENGITVAVVLPIPATGETRPFGLCAGEFSVPNDFNDPLPDEVLASFSSVNLL